MSKSMTPNAKVHRERAAAALRPLAGRGLAWLVLLAAGAAWAEEVPQGQSAMGEWRHHGGDHASSRYSPAAQIDGSNFGRLEVAWRWRTADHEVPLDVLPGYDTSHYRSVPLMIGGRLFAPTSLGQVALLDPATGEQKWVYNPRTWERGGTTMRPVGARGIEYWSDGEKERLFVATIGRQLVSIDAANGEADRAFGEDGVVDLARDLGPGEYTVRHITHGAPPIVVGNSVIVGSKIFDYSVKSDAPPGHVRAYDVHTGEFKWRFNTIPRDDEVGVETWENESWRTAGNANVWTAMSADHELGYVYLPTSTPSNDYYGADRPGDNLFAESLVCVDADHRRAHLALPDRPPRHLGLRHRLAAEPDRHRRRRQADQGRGSGFQDRLHLRLRPRDRQAGVADRGSDR